MSLQVQEWIRFLLPMASIFLVFWLLVIYPQRKEQKVKKTMIANLKKGDEVLTIGGVLGRVKLVKPKEVGFQEEGTVLLELSEGASMRVLLSAIERVVSQKDSKEKGDC